MNDEPDGRWEDLPAHVKYRICAALTKRYHWVEIDAMCWRDNVLILEMGIGIFPVNHYINLN